MRAHCLFTFVSMLIPICECCVHYLQRRLKYTIGAMQSIVITQINKKKCNKTPFSKYGPLSVVDRMLKFQPVSCLCCMYSSFRAAIKMGIIYGWAYPKVYVFRRLICIASASEVYLTVYCVFVKLPESLFEQKFSPVL